ncbi:hypothetical protein K440DRAFT_610019 [Wilcoxina mikolae CBS 423.85]|nr:hypothetical protein K440DRAFT_610019 [Wilcoxina mikolae CBS 423.85]
MAVDTPKVMYLMKPDFSCDDLTLKLTDSLHDAGTFCFDEETGWLLHPEVDRYSYIYRAHVKSVFPHNTMTMKVCWKRSAMVTELAPYRFMGRFQARKRREMGQVREIGLEWEFSGRDDPEGHSEKRRWDTKHTRLAGNFMVHGIEGGTSSGRSWWDILFRRDRRRTAGGSSGQQRLRHELSVVNPWTVEGGTRRDEDGQTVEGGTRRDEDGQTAPDEVLTEVERVPANEPGAATSQNNTRYELLMVPVHPGTEIE